MNYHPDLIQLQQRFETFIQKLIIKAKELETETRQSAQIFYDEDDDEHKRSYNQFKMGIEGQFKIIIEKAGQVFNTQIRPIRESEQYPHANYWYNEMSDTMTQFNDQVNFMINEVFDNVQELSSEVHLQLILDEYKEIEDAFHCRQCGANLPIEKIYFVATYIACPFCQTQNTFVPGSRTQALPILSREVAEERLAALGQKVEILKEANAAKANLVKAFNYYRASIWVIKSKIVPSFQDEFAKVYYRELYDYLYDYNIKKLDLTLDVYKELLEQYGFVQETMTRISQAYENKDLAKVKTILIEWEMLYALSAFTIPQLYQGEEHQGVYNKEYQRVQEQWAILSKSNKELSTEAITIDKIIQEIKTKFKYNQN